MTKIWTIAALTLLVLPGCPRGQSTTSGSSEAPADTRPAALGLPRAERRPLRTDAERRLHIIGLGDDQQALREAATDRLEAALRLLTDLDRLEGEGLSPRDLERAALEGFAAYLRAAVTGERTDFPTGSEVLPSTGPWARAVAFHDDGDVQAALQEGVAALSELTDEGLDSASMRVRLGDWALEAEDHDLALAWFASAMQAGANEASWGDEAKRRGDSTRALALGPDAAALVAANGLIDAGDLAGAAARLELLLDEGVDPDVLADAREVLGLVFADATDVAIENLARAAAILEGPGPYGDVGPLLAGVAALPEGTFDADELLRLQGWLRGRTGQEDAATTAARRRAVDATLGDARDLVIAGEYRSALKAFAKLDGTEHQTVARREARQAEETLVKEERERAGRLVVAARKMSEPRARSAALEEVREILAGLLADFPRSPYAARLQTNLDAVEREIAEQ